MKKIILFLVVLLGAFYFIAIGEIFGFDKENVVSLGGKLFLR